MTGNTNRKKARTHFKAKITLDFESDFVLPERERFASDTEWKQACANHIAWCWANCDEYELGDYMCQVKSITCGIVSIDAPAKERSA
ncbi:MAG: hypothetical protein IJ026_05625 [Candidatus Methanomethylophilaceae archaeon]|nr:hypothetical protein [Candidatus Methanomethylophilaceae archaeon]